MLFVHLPTLAENSVASQTKIGSFNLRCIKWVIKSSLKPLRSKFRALPGHRIKTSEVYCKGRIFTNFAREPLSRYESKIGGFLILLSGIGNGGRVD